LSTIRDVAREAGVGLGTVSRVLNGGANVSDATRNRIEETMRRLDYRPNLVARALSRRQSDVLEVIVPLVTREFYVEVLRGIEEALAPTTYALVIHTVERAQDRKRIFGAERELTRRDGILIASLTPPESFVDQLIEDGTPAVLIDGEHPRLPSVGVDHDDALRQVVAHLTASGRSRIALIDRADDPFGPARASARQSGFRRALDAAGMPIDPELELIAGYSADGGRHAVEQLLDARPAIDAVIAGSDIQAIGAIDGIRARGLNVPDDIAAVGYNDIEVARYLDLATVQVPMRAMGRRATEILLAAIEGNAEPASHASFAAKLVVRGTAPAPKS
jgi:DNA-binding LacI/PurR family transcriptional regulator